METTSAEAYLKKHLRRRKVGEIKWKIKMGLNKIWWRSLHATKLAGPYSRAMCKFNLYRKFRDGRCQWCGREHQ